MMTDRRNKPEAEKTNELPIRWPILGVVAVVLAGCGATQAADGAGSDPAGVPAALLDLESRAESAYDHAIAGASTEVVIDADRIAEAWKSYRPQAVEEGLSTTTLTELDAAVAGLLASALGPSEPVALGRTANRISGSMDQLFELHDPVVPPDIIELDYLGREIALDGMDANVARAAADVDALTARWALVRVRVEDAGGAREATSFEESLSAIRTAVAAADGATITAQANELLDRVDGLEGVFAK